MYLSDQIVRFTDALREIDWLPKVDDIDRAFRSFCESLDPDYTILWEKRIRNPKGPGYVACVQLPEGLPKTVVIKFILRPGVTFSRVHEAIRKILWETGIYWIYATGEYWVAVEDVSSTFTDTALQYSLIADLWMRIHSIDISRLESHPAIVTWDAARELNGFFRCRYEESRSAEEHARRFFSDLKVNFDLIFADILNPDPRDIVFVQGELYPRHTFITSRGSGWECRVVDWDSAAIGPRWHDLTFYLRVNPELEDTLLLPIYIDMLSKEVPREYDAVMNIYRQYRLLRIMRHMSSGDMHRYFTVERVEQLRRGLCL